MVDRTGQQLGPYRLIRKLSEDGFAEVYLGEDLRLKTKVSIKILQAKVPKSEDMERFVMEARAIAHLQHPNIVRALDFGVQGEMPFLVMDYATQDPLQSTLRQRHPEGSILPLATIKSYVKQIAAALQYIHDQKLIHRDIKPENMVIGRNNEILLSGFSNVVVAQSSRYQNTQKVVGTPDYMAPEQIQGKSRFTSDQYSLAIVAYEWLCGDRPFHGSFTELCTQHLFATPPSLREKVPTVPQEVERVVMTALEKDPNKRFTSVLAFANAFEQASNFQQPTLVVPPPIFQTPPAQPVIASPQPTLDLYIVPPQQNVETRSSEAKSISSNKRAKTVRVWSIGISQIIAMIIGTILFIALRYSIYYWALPDAHAVDYSSTIFIIPALVVPVFFGATFGPWVGLVIGGIGDIVSNSIVLQQSSFFSNYFIYHTALTRVMLLQILLVPIDASEFTLLLGFASIGFIAGLAFIVTRGSYNTVAKIAMAGIIGAVGIIVGSSLSQILNQSSSLSIAFIHVILPDALFSLVFVPILLVIYNVITGRLKRT